MSTNIQCRYFIHGACKRGESCLYSHNLVSQPDMTCRFFLRGNCSYGKTCRYDHFKPNETSQIFSIATEDSLDVCAAEESEYNVNMYSNVHLYDEAEASADEGLLFDASSFVSNHIMHSQQTEPTQAKFNSTSMPNYIYNNNSYSDAISFSNDVNTYNYVDASSNEFIDYSAYDELSYAICGGVDRDTAEYDGLNEAYGGILDRNDKEIVNEEYKMFYKAYEGVEIMDICEFCGLYILPQNDQQLRDQHIKDCISEHEREMEEAFRVAASENRMCSVCMEVVWQKSPASRRRFGILSACNHVFCLECIRKWRAEDGYDNQVIRACPECRVLSDFVTPSKYWFESSEEKTKLINEYKMALSRKPCIYYKDRNGECPFSDSCFYLHEGVSTTPVRRRVRYGSSGIPERINRNLISDFIGLAEEMRSLLLTDLLSLLDSDHLL